MREFSPLPPNPRELRDLREFEGVRPPPPNPRELRDLREFEGVRPPPPKSEGVEGFEGV